MKATPRIWVVTELYYPEDGATGHLLTQIAEGLAESADVHVLCAQPNYTRKQSRAPVTETHNGVKIRRCRSTSFSKDRLALRLVNMLTVLISFTWNLAWRLRRGDTVLVVTNPPPLPFTTRLACWLRGSRCMLLIHDVYPDVLVPTGFVKRDSLTYRVINVLCRRLFRSMHQIITIGRDMQQRVVAKYPPLASKCSVIPNWCDESIHPLSQEENPLRKQLQLDNRFVVLYSGNLGRTHGLETIARAAKLVEDEGLSEIQWLVCGDGGGRASFEATCQELGLTSVMVRDFFPRDQLINSLNCGDVGIISFIPGMAGISVPSRMYNFFAAGKPVIGVTDPDSELALTITENKIGWVVEPDDHQKLAACVREIYLNQDQLPSWQQRSRSVAVQKFSRKQALDAYRNLLLSSVADSPGIAVDSMVTTTVND